MWIAYPLRWFYLVIFPLNWLLNAASVAILRMFGVAEASHAEVLSGEEIQGLIETSERHGNIESEKATMLHNMFEFDSRFVEEIMNPSACCSKACAPPASTWRSSSTSTAASRAW